MTEPTKATPSKATPKGKVLTGTVVLKTTTFDPYKGTLLDEAETLFRDQVAEAHGKEAKLSDVKLTGVDHHVGTSATYSYSAVLG